MKTSFLHEAIKTAEYALIFGEVPVGCVVVKNNEIVARSHNLTNTNNDPLAHAEVVALKQLEERNIEPKGLSFFITCEPCIMCGGILERINAKVVYGCKNDIFGVSTVLRKKLNIEMEFLYCERAVELLRLFFEGENRNAPEELRKIKNKNNSAK